MTCWTEQDFYTAILLWKKEISIHEAMLTNNNIPKSSWRLRVLQYDQIDKNIRKRGNDLKPIGKKVFKKYRYYKRARRYNANNIIHFVFIGMLFSFYFFLLSFSTMFNICCP